MIQHEYFSGTGVEQLFAPRIVNVATFLSGFSSCNNPMAIAPRINNLPGISAQASNGVRKLAITPDSERV